MSRGQYRATEEWRETAPMGRGVRIATCRCVCDVALCHAHAPPPPPHTHSKATPTPPLLQPRSHALSIGAWPPWPPGGTGRGTLKRQHCTSQFCRGSGGVAGSVFGLNVWGTPCACLRYSGAPQAPTPLSHCIFTPQIQAKQADGGCDPDASGTNARLWIRGVVGPLRHTGQEGGLGSGSPSWWNQSWFYNPF